MTCDAMRRTQERSLFAFDELIKFDSVKSASQAKCMQRNGRFVNVIRENLSRNLAYPIFAKNSEGIGTSEGRKHSRNPEPDNWALQLFSAIKLFVDLFESMSSRVWLLACRAKTQSSESAARRKPCAAYLAAGTNSYLNEIVVKSKYRIQMK